MKNTVKISVFLCVLFIACEGGMLTPDVGKTDKFTSLIEKMNKDVAFKTKTLNEADPENKFVDFKITGIESIEQLETNEASLVLFEANLEKKFNRTEIIRSEIETTDDNGNLMSRSILVILFGTNDQYYSESNFPIDEHLIITEYPNSRPGSSSIYITLHDGNSIYNSISQPGDNISENRSILSYEFTNNVFRIYNFRDYLDFMGETHGSGSISAEKIGQFPVL